MTVPAPYDHRRLLVYARARQLVLEVETVASALPTERNYLRDQMRRCAASISANIAEGAGEFSKREKARFYRYAYRSARELDAHVQIVADLKLRTPGEAAACRRRVAEVCAMLVRLLQRMDARSPPACDP